MSNRAANCIEKEPGDYQKMYLIAEEQKELYEIRIQELLSMAVSDTFQEI